MSHPWLRELAGGVELAILAQPRASRSRVLGEHDGRLKVQLAAPPVDGEANAALLALLASVLGVPGRALTLEAGATGRRKAVRVQGLSPEAVERALHEAMSR
ncbi:MAG: DUF167 domain-containing protein [Myxococcales bacterium]